MVGQKTGVVRTCALFLLPKCCPQALHRFLQVVLLFFHVLNCFVSLPEKRLQPPYFGEKPTSNFERKFCGTRFDYIQTQSAYKRIVRTDVIRSVSSIFGSP